MSDAEVIETLRAQLTIAINDKRRALKILSQLQRDYNAVKSELDKLQRALGAY